MYQVTPEEAFSLFKYGEPLYASSVGSDERHALGKCEQMSPNVRWVIEHTKLQHKGVNSPVQYWTD